MISIHAPAKGATVCAFTERGQQSHISIHAPAKGATWVSDMIAGVIEDFNPRSREGSDQDCPRPMLLP
mgnify:FL=1